MTYSFLTVLVAWLPVPFLVLVWLWSVARQHDYRKRSLDLLARQSFVLERIALLLEKREE